MNDDKLLSLGSIVYLKRGKIALMIVSRQPVVDLGSERVYFDYAGVSQILGLETDKVVYFNKENISQVIFEGYVSEEEPRIQEALREWRESNNQISKGKVK